MATTLALLLMTAVTAMLGRVSQSVTESRSVLESADRLGLAQTRLQMDLSGVTATVCPTLKPENNEGYFEYIEGPIGTALPMILPTMVAVNSDTGNPDATVGDYDDILMFTTRTTGKPFIGRYRDIVSGNDETIQSNVAEVAWFIRGHTLHRRVLLIAPNVALPNTTANFYANYDISARWDSINSRMVPNTLGDLTRREFRFAHCMNPTDTFPFRVSRWGQLGLPTLRECSDSSYNIAAAPLPGTLPTKAHIDFWSNNTSASASDNLPWSDYVVGNGVRMSDDVILTNVIGFDVKAWDPVQGAYVDLGYQGVLPPNSPTNLRSLNHLGQTLGVSNDIARVYDTWSTTNYGTTWNNGIDDGGDPGIVDDDNEKSNPPPYPIPLRGIQVKIRVFEPDSKQIREVTVEQDFLPR